MNEIEKFRIMIERLLGKNIEKRLKDGKAIFNASHESIDARDLEKLV